MNAIFNRLASFALGAILGAAMAAPVLADSVIAPPAVPAGYVDWAANANYATNAGYASSANYANSAGYAPSTGGGWIYLGPSGCYWNTTGKPAAVHAASILKPYTSSQTIGTLVIKDYSIIGIPPIASDGATYQTTLAATGIVSAGHQFCTWRTGFAIDFGVSVYIQQ